MTVHVSKVYAVSTQPRGIDVDPVPQDMRATVNSVSEDLGANIILAIRVSNKLMLILLAINSVKIVISLFIYHTEFSL